MLLVILTDKNISLNIANVKYLKMMLGITIHIRLNIFLTNMVYRPTAFEYLTSKSPKTYLIMCLIYLTCKQKYLRINY